MEPAATTEAPDRPWAVGVGLAVLGLFVSAVTNGFVVHGEPGPVLRAVGLLGWAAGLVVVGLGVHRLLWFRPSPRGPAARVLVTALVTPVAFALGALFFSVVMTILQARLRP